MSRLLARLFVILQYALPKHLLTAIVFHVAGIRIVSVKNFLIRHFANFYQVNIEEVELPVPDGFDNFNDFFTRQLVAGARPVAGGADSIVSPADGIVSAAGKLDANTILQAKGLPYSLPDLLMTDVADAEQYRDGDFATIYLAPSDYHRVHSPLDLRLIAARYIPGTLYSVNESTVSFLPNLFTRNERLVCHFEGETGPMILIFVGALHVGSITTPWTGRMRPRSRGTVQDLDVSRGGHSRQLQKGDLLGWFNMGSTVIVLLPPDICRFSPELVTGQRLRMGQAIGSMRRETR